MQAIRAETQAILTTKQNELEGLKSELEGHAAIQGRVIASLLGQVEGLADSLAALEIQVNRKKSHRQKNVNLEIATLYGLWHIHRTN